MLCPSAALITYETITTTNRMTKARRGPAFLVEGTVWG